MPSPRRFPPPWKIEELESYFVVKDRGGQKLGYFYYEEEPGLALDGETSHPRRGKKVREAANLHKD
jgi:hypothetical protein